MVTTKQEYLKLCMGIILFQLIENQIEYFLFFTIPITFYFFDNIFKLEVGLTTGIFLFGKKGFILAVFYSTLGDYFASLFGNSLGSWEEFKIFRLKNGKSVVGTLCSFIFCYSFSAYYLYVYYQINEKYLIPVSVFLSLIGCFAELLTPLNWNDNLVIPIASLASTNIILSYF